MAHSRSQSNEETPMNRRLHLAGLLLAATACAIAPVVARAQA